MYTESDIGCWIDGAFGMGHTMTQLGIMLIDSVPTSNANTADFPTEELARDYDILRGGCIDSLSDDHGELDSATEYLQSMTNDGLVWIWDSGDLILTTYDQAEN